MPLTKEEQLINRAVMDIELAKAEFRKIPIQTDSVYKSYYNLGLSRLRAATNKLNKIITTE